MRHWKEVIQGYRWERIDGAVVRWDERSPYQNHLNPHSRMWTAWEPEPSQRYLWMRRGRLRRAQDGHLFKPGFPRRWRTAEAAMRAVNREYPLQK